MSRIKWIINRYAGNDFPKKTDKAFRRWIASGENRQEKDEGLEEIWEKSRARGTAATYSDWLALKKRINGSGKARTIRMPQLYRIAAAIAVVAVTAVASVEITKNRTKDAPQQYSLYTQAGEKQTLILPDSSSVLLNSKSLVIYPEHFSKDSREIFVVGQAILKVAKDADRPFIVKTPNLSVEVLGTTFDISDYMDDFSGSVVLKEGRVRISPSDRPDNVLYLNPGEKATLSKESGHLFKTAADLSRECAGENDYICFNKTNIYGIARILEREFGIEVNVASNKYDDVSVTAKFMNDDSLEDFLFVLENIVPDFEYRLDGSYLYII